MNIFNSLAQSNNPVIAILASLVVVLSGVVVYQWKYTKDNTIPKWVFTSLITTNNEMNDRIKEMSVIIRERLKG